MRWARVAMDRMTTYAIVYGDRVLPVDGSPFESWTLSGESLALATSKLLVPVVPSTFYACGLNYTDHIKKLTGETAPVLPTKPDVGYRANNALIAHGETIVIPADAGEQVQYEGELVVVIGRKAKHLTAENAMSCVFGYTIGNDVSERSWQKSDRTFWRAKNSDTFKPMGPWIETEVDLDAMTTTVRINGRLMIRFSTNAMLFGISTFLQTLTRNVTLYPGDVVWMGTDGASANMRHGDLVEIEVSGIGTLRNPVIREVI